MSTATGKRTISTRFAKTFDTLRGRDGSSSSSSQRSSFAPVDGDSFDASTWIGDWSPLRNQLPLVLVVVLDQLDARNAKEEGLFRISGAYPEVVRLGNALWQASNSHNPNRNRILGQLAAGEANAHTLASVVTFVLRDLHEPLLTFALYDAFMQVTDEEQSLRPLIVRSLARLLPIGHQELLRRLVSTLSGVDGHAATNKMPATNLAICFGPLLLRTRDEAVEQVLRDADKVTRCVETLITHAEVVFASGDERSSELPEHHRVSGKMKTLYQAARAAMKQHVKELQQRSEALQRQTATAGAQRVEPATIIEHRKILTKEDVVARRLQAMWRGHQLRVSLRGVDRVAQAQYNHAVCELITRHRRLFQNFRELFQVYLSALRSFVSQDAYAELSLHVESTLHAMLSASDTLESAYARWPFVDSAGFRLVSDLAQHHTFLGVPPQYLAHLPSCLALLQACFEAMPSLKKYVTRMQQMSRVDGKSLDVLFSEPLEHLRHEQYGVSGPLAKLARLTYLTQRYDEARHWLQLHHLNRRICIVCDIFAGANNDRSVLQALNAIDFHKDDDPFRQALFAQDSGRGRRRLLRQGVITVASEKRAVFLFTDCFVVARVRKQGTRYQFKYLQWLKGCTIPPAADPMLNEFNIQAPHRCYTLCFRSNIEKMEWLTQVTAGIAAIPKLEHSFGSRLSLHKQNFLPPILVRLVERAFLATSSSISPSSSTSSLSSPVLSTTTSSSSSSATKTAAAAPATTTSSAPSLSCSLTSSAPSSTFSSSSSLALSPSASFSHSTTDCHALADAFILPADRYDLLLHRNKLEKFSEIDLADISRMSAGEVADLIIHYIEELPTPLLPWEMIKSQRLFSGKRPLLHEFRAMLASLPPVSRSMLQLITNLLTFAKTGFNLQLLSRILAPSICWPAIQSDMIHSEEYRTQVLLELFSPHYNSLSLQIVESLIVYHELLFSSEQDLSSSFPSPPPSTSASSPLPTLSPSLSPSPSPSPSPNPSLSPVLTSSLDAKASLNPSRSRFKTESQIPRPSRPTKDLPPPPRKEAN